MPPDREGRKLFEIRGKRANVLCLWKGIVVRIYSGSAKNKQRTTLQFAASLNQIFEVIGVDHMRGAAAYPFSRNPRYHFQAKATLFSPNPRLELFPSVLAWALLYQFDSRATLEAANGLSPPARPIFLHLRHRSSSPDR